MVRVQPTNALGAVECTATLFDLFPGHSMNSTGQRF